MQEIIPQICLDAAFDRLLEDIHQDDGKQSADTESSLFVDSDDNLYAGQDDGRDEADNECYVAVDGNFELCVKRNVGRETIEKTVDKDSSVFVNGDVELCASMVERLRLREWLNSWDIDASLSITDKPQFVQLGVSVPLHEKGQTGEIILRSRPLKRWRHKVDTWREGAAKHKEPQIFICPLNVGTNHFTLLEINEQTGTIRHYDSLSGSIHEVRGIVEVCE